MQIMNRVKMIINHTNAYVFNQIQSIIINDTPFQKCFLIIIITNQMISFGGSLKFIAQAPPLSNLLATTLTQNFNLRILMLVLLLVLAPAGINCYDYNIPRLDIELDTQTQQQYDINYLQDLTSNKWELSSSGAKDGIVRVKLNNYNLSVDPNDYQNYLLKARIQNIYHYEVVELEDDEKTGSDTGNQLCSVVKVIDQSTHKYLTVHQLAGNVSNPMEKFLYSVVSSQRHILVNQLKPQAQQQAMNITQTSTSTIAYALTSQLNLHIINTTQVQIQLNKINQDIKYDNPLEHKNKYQQRNTIVQKQILQWVGKNDGDGQGLCAKGAQQNGQVVGIYDFDGDLGIACYREGEIGVYFIVNVQSGKWGIDENGGVIIQSAQLPQIHLMSRPSYSQKSYLIVLTNNKIYKVRPSQSNSSSKSPFSTQLPLPTSILPLLIHPTYIMQNSTPVAYILMINKVLGLQFYNIQQKKIQYSQDFNHQIDMSTVSLITFRNGNDISVGKNVDSGVILMVLMLEGNRQFIVEILYETGHKLHINKIYHSYNANTNQAHVYSSTNPTQDQAEDEQLLEQRSNINAIKKILHPSAILPNQLSNNIGILQSKHKLLFFQYGIPRTISPYVTANSEFITQKTFTNIIDAVEVRTINFPEVQNKDLNQVWANRIISEIQAKGNKTPIKFQIYLRYLLLLDRYIHVLQINPNFVWHYEYVCNLNSVGVINQRHSVLNDVRIQMEGLCQKDIQNDPNSAANVSKSKLVYCESKKTIKFFVNYLSLQNQRDRDRHIIFAVVGTFVGTCVLAFGIAFYGHLKIQINKFKQIIKKTREKRSAIPDDSKIQQLYSQSQPNSKKDRRLMKEEEIAND